MKNKRKIIHADVNYFYAQVEELKNPMLKKYPTIVGGDESKRQGIVLAKNRKTKRYNIKTGESLQTARRKCLDVIIVPPRFEDYVYYSKSQRNF